MLERRPDNGSFSLLSRPSVNNTDLIITRESIHEGEEHVGSSIIDQGIDMWQWKVILRVSLVQIPIVNSDRP